MVVRFSVDCGLSRVDRLLKLRNEAIESAEKSVLFDLESTRKITPFTACFMAAFIDEMLNDGRRVSLLKPVSPSCLHQLDFMGISNRYWRKEISGSRTVRTVPLLHRKDADYDLAFEVAAMITQHHHLEKSYLYVLQLCFRELLQNAYQHAASKKGVYTCAQVVRTRRRTSLCVYDEGIGIRRHLSGNPKHKMIADDVSAIRVALKKNTSGTGKQRGLGLFLISKVISSIGGRIDVISGNGHVVADAETQLQCTTLKSIHQGTIVNVTFEAQPGYRFNLDDYED